SKAPEQGWNVKFDVIASDVTDGPPEAMADLLVVSATDAGGKQEVVKVAVNDKALPPSQYIQCKINQGAFSKLETATRQRVENAIGSYMHAFMLPKVPPAYVNEDMSLEEIQQEISLRQRSRKEAIRQIQVLKGIIDAALEE
nr:hypothetical protein [Gammaproteobacteria bacterium]NIR95788.1 hypothetical protein [Gammaproteobacteria bacterium]NIW46417.1 hypothetical protein [Gammaproteobacteria bacterium]